MTPSPLRSWWKLVSSVSSAALLPAYIAPETKLPLLSVFQIEILIGAGDLQRQPRIRLRSAPRQSA